MNLLMNRLFSWSWNYVVSIQNGRYIFLYTIRE